MLHAQARALLDLIEKRGIPPTHALSVTEARQVYRDRRFTTQPAPPDVGAVESLQAEGPHGPIPLRLYRPLGVQKDAQQNPQQAALPALVFFHGGGWVIGDLETHDTLCRQLCNGAGCIVVAVDYRMAPEHRFPVAVDDSLAATEWIGRHAAMLGIDEGRIALGGDSAGGNLAAVVALAARDAQRAGSGRFPRIAYQLLIYPVTDMRQASASYDTNGNGYLLTRETMEWFRGHYVDSVHHDDWRASPLLHADLDGLPPALVLTAGFDPLRDEGFDYANRLTLAGCRTSYVCFQRQIHGFILMGRVLDEANTAVALCAAELRRALLPAM